MNKENAFTPKKSVPLPAKSISGTKNSGQKKTSPSVNSFSQPLQPSNNQSSMQYKSIDLNKANSVVSPSKISSFIPEETLSPIHSAGTLQKQFKLQKAASQSFEGNPNSNDWQQCQLNKQASQEYVDENNSRRFSVFSKSSFATSSSFLFGTRVFNKSMIQSKSVPKVNISSIFKNKAFLYLDEALCNTFDDLLEKGHTIVTQKKEERDILKDHEEAMKAEVVEMEKDIVPLIQRSQQCNEQIQRQKELQYQYEHEIILLQEEMEQLKSTILYRQDEVANNHNQFTETIKNMEISNNELKSSTNISRASHKQEANSQNQHKKQKEQQLNSLVTELTNLKGDYESKKNTQADRLRKMENKQKMYMGILKH